MLAIIALFLATQAAPAAPPLTPEQSDGRCIAAFGVMSANPKEEVQRAGQVGGMYFYGRLLGRNHDVNLVAVITEAAASMSSDPKVELKRCAAELETAGELMQAAGAKYQAAEKAHAQPQPSTPHKP